MYIENINGPQDVKKLTIDEMRTLAEEMRHALLIRASKHGGHFGPNFGMVEAICLYRCYDCVTRNKFEEKKSVEWLKIKGCNDLLHPFDTILILLYCLACRQLPDACLGIGGHMSLGPVAQCLQFSQL